MITESVARELGRLLVEAYHQEAESVSVAGAFVPLNADELLQQARLAATQLEQNPPAIAAAVPCGAAQRDTVLYHESYCVWCIEVSGTERVSFAILDREIVAFTGAVTPQSSTDPQVVAVVTCSQQLRGPSGCLLNASRESDTSLYIELSDERGEPSLRVHDNGGPLVF